MSTSFGKLAVFGGSILCARALGCGGSVATPGSGGASTTGSSSGPGGVDTCGTETAGPHVEGKPFACGPLTCDGATEYCLDDFMLEDVFDCEPLPACCLKNPTCECLSQELGNSPSSMYHFEECVDGALRVYWNEE